jgi:hypothetical protein
LFREPHWRLDLERAIRHHVGEQTGTADSRSALPLTAEEVRSKKSAVLNAVLI